MSILKSLKLTTAQPTRASNDPVERARNKVLALLAEQRSMVEAKLAGQHYAPTHMVWRKNPEGQRIQIELPKRLRPFWFTDAGGQLFFALRYAGKQIELSKDRNAVAVSELSAMPSILDTLADAIRAGELDEQLSNAAAERGHLLRKAS